MARRELVSAKMLFNTTDDIIKDTNRRIAAVAYIRKKIRHSAPFEAGFVACVIQEKYRRMVDKYNVSHYMKKRLYTMELIMYLEEIEHHYWEIDHLYGMFHEIERKFHVQERKEINDYVETTSEGWRSTGSGKKRKSTSYRPPKPKKTRKRDKEYVYEKLLGIDLHAYLPNLSPPKNRIIKDLSWPSKLKILRDNLENRRVGLQYLRQGSEKPKSEDSNMKMKLFRLMYETVRDSDLKVRRAELIRGHYINSSAFDMGFIIGDITDKYNIMTDISLTLKRLYHEWKPMEHINAYEQIANKAIEITNLIDMIRIIEKKALSKPATDVRSKKTYRL
ncbi:uncharacterized protein LOC119838479 [Zerene cesonia]|uniref:uncharacterized protein LOC119838479 n=1 Tax=Zerene cesonia TaxID=33412 RepID=UPI0018E5210D|nr:uncharacterized protein LOC119838479 [Zerene cesonia]